MGNCLVTKLKEIVDNDNLDVLNEVTIACAAMDGYFGIVADEANTVKLTLDGGTVSGQTEVYAPASGTLRITPIQGASVVKLKANPKYNITELASTYPLKGLRSLAYNNITKLSYISARTNEGLWDAIGDINISDFAFMKNKVLQSLDIDGSNNNASQHMKGNIEALKGFNSLTFLRCNLTRVTGDIINLKDLTSLATLVLNFGNVSGNIANLGKLKSLTKLGFRTNSTTKVQGTVEDFVKAQVANPNGRTTGEITIVGNLGAVTFNGKTLPNDTTERTLSWVPKAGNKTTITFNGVEVDIDN